MKPQPDDPTLTHQPSGQSISQNGLVAICRGREMEKLLDFDIVDEMAPMELMSA